MIKNRILSALLMIFLLSLVAMFLVTGLRYYHKISNLTALNKPRVYREDIIADAERNVLNTIYDNKTTITQLVQNKQIQNIRSWNFLRLIEAFSQIGLSSLETRASHQLLKGNKEEIGNLQASHINNFLFRSIRKSIILGDYENARYRAQRYINSLSVLDDIWEYNRKIMYARKVIKLVRNNYIYNSREIVELVDSINWNDDVEWRSNKEELKHRLENAYKRANTSLSDNILYALYDLEENAMGIQENISLWRNFLLKHPNSELADEADFNEILAMFKGQLTILHDHPELYSGLVNDFDKKVNQFLENKPQSYLADDVLYYAILFAGLDLNHAHIYEYLQLLVGQYYNGSARVNLFSRLFSKPNSVDCTDFIVDSIQNEGKVRFDEYLTISKLSSQYLKDINFTLRRYEGRDYRGLTLEKIIGNIVIRYLDREYA